MDKAMMMYIPEHYMSIIMSTISKVFDEHNAVVKVYEPYKGKTIAVDDRYGTRIWIRLMFNRNTVAVDLSTIELRRGLRRKGILTDICRRLSQLNFVSNIWITSPCTPEIMEFGKKHNLYLDKNNYRFIVK